MKTNAVLSFSAFLAIAAATDPPACLKSCATAVFSAANCANGDFDCYCLSEQYAKIIQVAFDSDACSGAKDCSSQDLIKWQEYWGDGCTQAWLGKGPNGFVSMSAENIAFSIASDVVSDATADADSAMTSDSGSAMSMSMSMTMSSAAMASHMSSSAKGTAMSSGGATAAASAASSMASASASAAASAGSSMKPNAAAAAKVEKAGLLAAVAAALYVL